MNRTIEIIVSPRGETRLQTKGFTGSACQDASRALEEALGRKQAEKRTAEFYAVNSSAENETEKHKQ